MDHTYDALLADWRAAAGRTRDAQQKLKEAFELFLQGGGSEPSKAEIDRVQALRDVENAKLEAALAYVRKSARGAQQDPNSPSRLAAER